MTVSSWKSGVSADWSTAADWSPAGAPNAATADTVIAAAGAYTVTIAAAESFLVDTLAFEAGGGVTLAVNGKLTLGGTFAEFTQNSGKIALAGSIAGGTLALDGGVLVATGAGTIGSAVLLGGAHGGTIEAAAGQLLTLAGALTWHGGDMAGAGTVETSGTTTIGSPAFLDGGVTWVNGGTVLDGAAIDDDAKLTTSTLANRFVNAAGGTFDVTGDGFQAFIDAWSSAPSTFANAGLLQKTAGTGLSSVWASLQGTGTITATAGTLELDAGGTLDGTIGGTSGGVVQLGAAPGFATTGTLAILDAGSAFGLRLVNGADWTDSGTIDDAGNLLLGNGTSATLSIAAGAVFEFTTDDGNIVYGGDNTLDNAGLIAKVGGTGTSSIGLGFLNSGTVDAASGTLRLLSGLGGTGKVLIGAGATLELAGGAIADLNTIDFAGAGATLKLDSASTVVRPMQGFGAGSAIDLGFAASALASIRGSTLEISPAGGTALPFRSTASLAGLYVFTGGDGAGGAIVGLTATAQVQTGTTLAIVGVSAADATFAGAGVLRLDDPTRYTGTLTGLAAGDQIALQGIATATKVSVIGADLIVTHGARTLSLATDGRLDGLSFVVTKDAGGHDSIITAEAVNTNPVQILNLRLPDTTVDVAPTVDAEAFGTSTKLNGDTFAGFGGSDLIDFTDMRFAAATFTWTGTASGGTLTVTDGVHAAAITLTGRGNFSATAFGLAVGLHGGTEVLFV